jgi:hypothetical protein
VQEEGEGSVSGVARACVENVFVWHFLHGFSNADWLGNGNGIDTWVLGTLCLKRRA